ncbi:two-component system regulatory protein YycI [Thermovorax subterraneus]|nr:two-component system regulatory protein YycI [Thermovorax subterraneus]
MDWRKAIGILTVSFFVLNIVLIINLFMKTLPEQGLNLGEGKEQAIRNYLESRGIKLATQLPAKWAPLPFLEVGRESLKTEELIKIFLPGKIEKVEDIEDGKKYISGGRRLIFTESGSVIFENDEKTENIGDLDETKAVEIAERFIKVHGGLPEDASLNYVKYNPEIGGYEVEYIGNYKGFFIANRYIRLSITPHGVVKFQRSFLKPVAFKGKRRQVIPPLTAVLKVDAERKNNTPMIVKKVEQGFYSQFYNAERWLAAPVWKVELNNGEVYYVNAYTGELER